MARTVLAVVVQTVLAARRIHKHSRLFRLGWPDVSVHLSPGMEQGSEITTQMPLRGGPLFNKFGARPLSREPTPPQKIHSEMDIAS
jgi:hypothetical protein